MSEREDNLAAITGLWKRTDKNGEEYFCGNFGECDVFVFKTKKSKDNHPDYMLKFGKKLKKEPKESEKGFEGMVPF